MQARMKLTGAKDTWLEANVGLTAGYDASIGTAPYSDAALQTQAFGLPFAAAEPVAFGSFVCSVDKGASVNCPTITMCAHSNGTHTECVGHILPGGITLADVKEFP